jgi:hypothetical protein
MRRRVACAVTMAVAMAAVPAAAQAQAPSYGGGLLPNAGAKVRYSPLLGIVLQPRGGQIAVRFDTYIRCGSDDYQIVGRKTVPFDGRSFRAKAARQIRIGVSRGNRVVYAWNVRGQADGTIASGRVRIAGVRIVGRKRTACTRKPTRRFTARIQGAAPTGAPTPPPRSGFGGVSDQSIGGGLPAPVMLRVTPSGRRIFSRWNVVADCGRGPNDDFANYTPSMPIRPDGSFSRAERFSVGYADVFIRYRVRFAGRVSGEYANGTLRLRSRVYTPNGKRLLTRCDSGLHNWSAAMLRPIAPAG